MSHIKQFINEHIEKMLSEAKITEDDIYQIQVKDLKSLGLAHTEKVKNFIAVMKPNEFLGVLPSKEAPKLPRYVEMAFTGRSKNDVIIDGDNYGKMQIIFKLSAFKAFS